MVDIRDTLYIPGFGFVAGKTRDQSLGSAEADFAALMEEAQAAREACSIWADDALRIPDPNAILPTDSTEVKLEKLRRIAETADYTGMSYGERYRITCIFTIMILTYAVCCSKALDKLMAMFEGGGF